MAECEGGGLGFCFVALSRGPCKTIPGRLLAEKIDLCMFQLLLFCCILLFFVVRAELNPDKM